MGWDWAISSLGNGMTPEQVTRLKGWMFAMLGAGIACLFMAYQYAIPPVGRAEPPPEFAPYLFAGIGIVCLIVAAIIARKTSKDGTPAATTDLKSPQGKTVVRLMAVGLIAMAGLTGVNFFAPEGDPLWLALSVVLLLVMGVCFISAGRIARKIRQATAATGASKE
jgi:peptidoglycan/LPS O-acetylase OafA/YrhL